jgi:hypothetical protein
MRIMVLHGWGGSPSPDRKKILDSKFERVYYPHIDYDLEWRGDRGKSLIQYLSSIEVDVYMGFSLGGYTAMILGMINQKPMVLVNPALNRRKTKLEIGDWDIDWAIDNRVPIEIFFGLEDRLIPKTDTLQYLEEKGIEFVGWDIPKMGHRTPISDFSKIIKKSHLLKV